MTTYRRARAAGLGLAVSVTTLTLLPVTAVADDLAALMTVETARALQTCIAENKDAERLACYDAAVKRPAGRHTTTTPEQRFGLSAAQVVQREHIAAAPKDVTAKVTAVGRGPGGILMVTLANGQVWAQQNADGQELTIDVGDSATVSHELMGGYLLTSSASGHRSMRVHRIH